MTYGSGAVAGTLCSDTVSIAGMTLDNHAFGVTTQVSFYLLQHCGLFLRLPFASETLNRPRSYQLICSSTAGVHPVFRQHGTVRRPHGAVIQRESMSTLRILVSLDSTSLFLIWLPNLVRAAPNP